MTRAHTHLHTHMLFKSSIFEKVLCTMYNSHSYVFNFFESGIRSNKSLNAFSDLCGCYCKCQRYGESRGVELSECHPGTDRSRSSGLTLSFDFCVITDWGMDIMSTKMQVGKLLWM